MPDSPLLISIIIVTWKTPEITQKCVRTINQFLEGKIKYEIIIADNDSRDLTKKLVSSMPHVIYFNTGSNLGFAKANNLAYKQSSGDYLFFLNSDIELIDDSILKMLNYLQNNPKIGCIGPQMLNPDMTIQASVFPPQTPFNAFKQYWLNLPSYEKYVPAFSEPSSVWSISGGALLISKNIFSQINLWSTKYFMYFEDLELCRSVRNLGKLVYYFPQSKVIHRHGASGTKLGNTQNQWRRLIPGSITYHGYLLHHTISFIIWSGQKWQKLRKNLSMF